MSMITGAHSIIYSKKPEADRAFMRDVLKLHEAQKNEFPKEESNGYIVRSK